VGTINGTLTKGVVVSGVTMSLYANVTQIGSWSLSASQNGVTFTGSGTFTATGCQVITLTGAGTPTNTGSTTFTTNGTPSGSATATVVFNSAQLAQFTRAAAGSLSGKSCFDIALSNDNTNSCGPLSARNVNKSDFTLSSVNTQTYTFTPSGAVSNVRFQYVNTNGQVITAITGGNAGSNIISPVTATVSYNTNLNTLALGLKGSNPLTADIYVIFNDGNGDKTLKLTANIKDCLCCGAFVAPNQFKEFLCHNLGADVTLDPNVPALGLIGAFIQFGKRGPNYTGDSRIDWQTAPNNGPLGFKAASKLGNIDTGDILGWSKIYAVEGNNAWDAAGVKTINDPCPSGYRVPSIKDWQGVIANNTVSRTGTFATGTAALGTFAAHFGPNSTTKLLTFPITLGTEAGTGALQTGDTVGYYWSSTDTSGTIAANANNSKVLDIGSTTVSSASVINKLCGLPIRCIAE
jgi:uncharacterized protein (TIGR02145 family)